jgi:hypothetical protein
MRLNILCDAHWESRADRVLHALSATGYRSLFAARDYGQGLAGITVVLMCRDPSLKFKQRVRLVKKERKLYLDIMLDFDRMREADDGTRRGIVVERLASEIPAILSKYSIADFDEQRFVGDLRQWLEGIG